MSVISVTALVLLGQHRDLFVFSKRPNIDMESAPLGAIFERTSAGHEWACVAHSLTDSPQCTALCPLTACLVLMTHQLCPMVLMIQQDNPLALCNGKPSLLGFSSCNRRPGMCKLFLWPVCQ